MDYQEFSEDELTEFLLTEEDRLPRAGACEDHDRFYLAHFFDGDVEKAFKTGGNDMGIHDGDWVSFYDEDKIRERQKRWEEEKESAPEKKDPGRMIDTGGKPYVRQTFTGRNDPCPRGSGKKYKKCCLGK